MLQNAFNVLLWTVLLASVLAVGGYMMSQADHVDDSYEFHQPTRNEPINLDEKTGFGQILEPYIPRDIGATGTAFVVQEKKFRLKGQYCSLKDVLSLEIYHDMHDDLPYYFIHQTGSLGSEYFLQQTSVVDGEYVRNLYHWGDRIFEERGKEIGVLSIETTPLDARERDLEDMLERYSLEGVFEIYDPLLGSMDLERSAFLCNDWVIDELQFELPAGVSFSDPAVESAP